MKDVARALSSVFGVSEESGPFRLNPSPPQDYVDAIGEPIDGSLLRLTVKSPEEVWGVEAVRVVQSRIAQARRFREWALVESLH
jgi:hypothetical protein